MPFVFPYSNIQLTGQINKLPNEFGLLQKLDLFPGQGINSTVVEVRMREGKIEVLAAAARGGPSAVAENDDGGSIYFGVPHFPEVDLLTPNDIQDQVEVAGEVLRPMTREDELARRLEKIRRKHDITREFLRVGALKGIVIDGKGAVQANLFEKFGIAKKQVAFNLGSETTDIIDKCEEVFDHIATNLKGEVMTGVELVVSKGFFNSFVQHPKVEKFWLQSQNAISLTSHERDPLAAYGRTFSFQNLLFREYKAQFPVKVNGAATSVPAVAANMGHAYPAGTGDTFATYDAAVYHMDMVNQRGLEIFVSQEPLKHGEGVELKSQSNPLPICRRPEVLVEITADASF